MENEVYELREEIEVLNERIKYLEKKERHRQTYTYIKILIRVLLLCAIAYGIWYGYDYVTHSVPKMIEEKITNLNPFKRN